MITKKILLTFTLFLVFCSLVQTGFLADGRSPVLYAAQSACPYYSFSLSPCLKLHYSTLRKKYFYEYAARKKQGDLRYFVAAVLHDLEELKWSECDLYAEKHGEKCNRYSREKLCAVLNFICNNYRGSCRAEQIYNYVNAVVRYREERGEYPRFPVETLCYRTGDCEDQAMALAALLKLAGYTTAIYVIHDPKYDINHCVCVCKVPDYIKGKKWRIKEYRDWGHCWLMLDPAYNNRFGANPSWVDNYLRKSGYLVIPDKVANCLLVDFDAYKAFCEKVNY